MILGILIFDFNNFEVSNFVVIVKVGSVDLNDEVVNNYLDNGFVGVKMFDVENYFDIIFVSIGIEMIGDVIGKIMGNFIIKDVMKLVMFDMIFVGVGVYFLN